MQELQETWVRSLGGEDLREKEIVIHSSIKVFPVAQIVKNLLIVQSCPTLCRETEQLTLSLLLPVFLPAKSHEQRTRGLLRR